MKHVWQESLRPSYPLQQYFLALAFEHQNVAFMVGLSYSIAASANFPVLALALFWRRLTTAGAVSGILVGAGASVLLIVSQPRCKSMCCTVRRRNSHDCGGRSQ